MTLLQFILIVSAFVFCLFAFDAYQRKKLNFLHFFVFFGGTALILVFAWDVNLLNKFGSFFGIARGADLLVYISIILLGYFYFEILNKVNKNSLFQSKIVSQLAIAEFNPKDYQINDSQNFKDQILFLIRAWNEAKVIGDTIDQVFAAGFNKILVVNDGSKDQTAQIIKQKQDQYKDKTLILISHFTNRGGGAANKTGFEFLKKYREFLKISWFVTFDADGQMDPSDITKFIDLAQSGNYDILLGSRFVAGGSAQNIPLMRKFILFGSKIITYIFNGIWVSDPHNGYRMLSLDSIQNIVIDSDGFSYASELLDEINRLKLKFKEIPVNIKYTQYSLSKGQKNSNAINILLELIYSKLFKK